MYTTQVRVHQAYQRAVAHKRQQQTGWIAALRGFCCALLALDISVLVYISDAKRYYTPERWMYGTTLLPSDAGGYVLVAVVAFVVAVAVTIVCMKNHEKAKHQEEEG